MAETVAGLSHIEELAAKWVREAIEQHRDEVVELTTADYAKRAGYGDYVERGTHHKLCYQYAAGAEEALDCLLALVEGKPWPSGGEK